MTKCIICRPGLTVNFVGPFNTDAEAQTWQKNDEQKFGAVGEWTIWPLFSPEEATEEAAGASAAAGKPVSE